jgi:hypothetical protein
MVVTYRLIKDNGHAAQLRCVHEILLQLSRLAFRSPEIDVQGLRRGLCSPSLYSA